MYCATRNKVGFAWRDVNSFAFDNKGKHPFKAINGFVVMLV